jgi:hypothetical protein
MIPRAALAEALARLLARRPALVVPIDPVAPHLPIRELRAMRPRGCR